MFFTLCMFLCGKEGLESQKFTFESMLQRNSFIPESFHFIQTCFVCIDSMVCGHSLSVDT
jgi:hypothetical protein